MADYLFPTVVWPPIPAEAMSPLELAVLTQMFEHDADGGTFYFYAEAGSTSTVSLAREDLLAALDYSAPQATCLVDLARCAVEEQGDTVSSVELDVSDLGEAAIFQDILKRCADLERITITSAWTCTRMRPDGFGGSITVVTAKEILSGSTNQLERDFVDRAEHGALACAPGFGTHQVLTLSEQRVREEVDRFAAKRVEAGSTSTLVDDATIREICVALIAQAGLEGIATALVHTTALAALAQAQRPAT